MTCFIFGDCLALGLAAVMSGCQSDARVGIPSAAVIVKAPEAHYDLVVVSTGSNDPVNPRLPRNLEAIREKLHADRIVWVRPVNAAAGRAVAEIAAKHGDGIAHVIPGRDHVHPKSYHVLAETIFAVR